MRVHNWPVGVFSVVVPGQCQAGTNKPVNELLRSFDSLKLFCHLGCSTFSNLIASFILQDQVEIRAQPRVLHNRYDIVP